MSSIDFQNGFICGLATRGLSVVGGLPEGTASVVVINKPVKLGVKLIDIDIANKNELLSLAVSAVVIDSNVDINTYFNS